MSARLERVKDWEALAQAADYQPRIIARSLRISLRTLERYFLSYFGLTPATWIEELRMREAVAFLNQGESVKEVAGRLKYKHPSNFTNAFTRKWGICPREYFRRLEQDPAKMSR